MKIYIGSIILFLLIYFQGYSQEKNDVSDVYFLQADSLVDLEKYDEAIILLDSAIHHNAENFDAYSLKGYCYFHLHNYFAALEAFDYALILEPNYAEVYYLRGLTKLELNQEKKACEDFIEAYALGLNDAMKFIEEYCDLDEIEKN